MSAFHSKVKPHRLPDADDPFPNACERSAKKGSCDELDMVGGTLGKGRASSGSRRCFVLALSMLLALGSGSAYGISAFQLHLMQRFGFTGADTDICFTVAFLCNVLEPGGFIFAAAGSRPAMLYGCFFLVIGVCSIVSTLAVLSERRWLGNADALLLAACFGCIAHASSVLYTTALFSTVSFFDGGARQGTAIGLVFSGFGLSAAVWVSLYGLLFEEDLQSFFVVFGAIYGTAALTYLCCVYVPPPPKHPKRDCVENMKFMEVANEDNDVGAWRGQVAAASPEDARARACGGACAAPCAVVQTREVLVFAFAFALFQGAASGVLLGNVSLLARAYGASEDFARTLVSMWAICNCTGRILSGMVIDTYPAITKPTLLFLSGLAILTACALLPALGDSPPLAVACLLFLVPGFAYGFNSTFLCCYGATWAIMSSFMAAELGPHNSAIGFAVSSIATAPVSNLASSVSGYLYAAEARRSTSASASTVCLGARCFRTALWLAALFCGAAALVALALRRHVRLRALAARRRPVGGEESREMPII